MRRSSWSKLFERRLAAITRSAVRSGTRAFAQALKPAAAGRVAAPPAGAWIPGVAMGTSGARRFGVYRPPDVRLGERLPLLVMLHGCGQDAKAFASVTRMNRIARRERFLVLYPEQDRLANAHGCWNWFDTTSGRAYGEAALIMKAIDQVCLLHPVDRARVAIAGLSAGASMAALLVTRHPGRFKAVVMHSGVPPGEACTPLSAMGAMQGRRRTRAAVAPATTDLAPPWPPLLVIHGEDDAVVSCRNGRAAAHLWADRGGARPGPSRSVQRGRRHTMSVTDFKHQTRTVATLVEVGGLAHAWSGGAANRPYSDGCGPDASRMVWAFAARQFGA